MPTSLSGAPKAPRSATRKTVPLLAVALTLSLSCAGVLAAVANTPAGSGDTPWWGQPAQPDAAANTSSDHTLLELADHTSPAGLRTVDAPANPGPSAQVALWAGQQLAPQTPVFEVSNSSGIGRWLVDTAGPVQTLASAPQLVQSAQQAKAAATQKTAQEVKVAPKPKPKPAATSKPAPAQTPKPTAAPKLTATPKPSATPTPAPSPSPTPTAQPTPTPTAPAQLPKVAGTQVIGEGGTPATNRALAQRLASTNYGWDAQQFQCLDQLWDKESRWNHRAANPSSAARGIAQTMMSVHFRNINPSTGVNEWWQSASAQEFLNSPQRQIVWGLNYIRNHRNYGDPCAAWEYWQVQGWY